MSTSPIVMISLLILPLIVLSSAAEDTCRNKSSQLCCGGQTGTNGIPGMHGIQASPGRDGRDGRDGARGDRGLPGRTGRKGPAGAEGKKGDKGDAGFQGPAGQKGQQGEKGESGASGSPQLSSHMNWKECTWKHGDDKDQGLIRNCEFMKNFTDTALHVYFAGNLRIYNCVLCCSRWHFTFNGAECSSPGPIDCAFYMQTGRNHDLYRHRHIEGHCKPQGKGASGILGGKVYHWPYAC